MAYQPCPSPPTPSPTSSPTGSEDRNSVNLPAEPGVGEREPAVVEQIVDSFHLRPHQHGVRIRGNRHGEGLVENEIVQLGVQLLLPGAVYFGKSALNQIGPALIDKCRMIILQTPSRRKLEQGARRQL